MAEESAPSADRLVNFVSEQQLDISKKTRGERIEDGTAQRGRPLYEVLREKKEKKDAEFNERFKHRPPKALDEDDVEFLDKLDMSRREYERQIADEEAKQLRSFQAAVAARAEFVIELKETPRPVVTKVKEQNLAKRKMPTPTRPSINVVIKVKPQQAKKAKLDHPACSEEPCDRTITPNSINTDKSSISLVSYSDDESEED